MPFNRFSDCTGPWQASMEGAADITSIIHPLQSHPLPLGHFHSFHFQQRALHIRPALVFSQLAARSYRSMARDYNREWISRQGVSYRPCPAFQTQTASNPSIRAYPSPRNPMFRQKDQPLKLGTIVQSNPIQFKPDRFPGKKGLNPFSQLNNRSAGSPHGMWKNCSQAIIRRVFFVRQQDLMHSGPGFGFPPYHSQHTESRRNRNKAVMEFHKAPF